MMKKVKITLSYDGTRFGGWQKQIHGKPTIQGEVEAVLQKIFQDHRLRICGAGRTDAGVHAHAQVAHFWAPDKAQDLPLLRALNGLLPTDISVSSAHIVCDEFHAIASSEKKTYVYQVYNSPLPSALRSRYCLWWRRPLDLVLLNQLASRLIGTKDFSCFQSSGSEVSSTERTIYSATWEKDSSDPSLIKFKIEGNGFLKQMVRNIVGTSLHIHEKQWGAERMDKIILSLDRRQAFHSAAGKGLFLKKVDYPSEISKPLKILI